ncbi:hypothetical protein ElyMa_006273900 [Elysia marginata]|uniref:F-box domain-containing protein n=1 Tax=Elysia marginata TaxID=1093978 RepID=A0AAV4HB28_9GAST|nr:hypothetical protein ElyMa_006273900 [Elysia marginata]
MSPEYIPRCYPLLRLPDLRCLRARLKQISSCRRSMQDFCLDQFLTEWTHRPEPVLVYSALRKSHSNDDIHLLQRELNKLCLNNSNSACCDVLRCYNSVSDGLEGLTEECVDVLKCYNSVSDGLGGLTEDCVDVLRCYNSESDGLEGLTEDSVDVLRCYNSVSDGLEGLTEDCADVLRCYNSVSDGLKGLTEDCVDVLRCYNSVCDGLERLTEDSVDVLRLEMCLQRLANHKPGDRLELCLQRLANRKPGTVITVRNTLGPGLDFLNVYTHQSQHLVTPMDRNQSANPDSSSSDRPTAAPLRAATKRLMSASPIFYFNTWSIFGVIASAFLRHEKSITPSLSVSTTVSSSRPSSLPTLPGTVPYQVLGDLDSHLEPRDRRSLALMCNRDSLSPQFSPWRKKLLHCYIALQGKLLVYSLRAPLGTFLQLVIPLAIVSFSLFVFWPINARGPEKVLSSAK